MEQLDSHEGDDDTRPKNTRPIRLPLQEGEQKTCEGLSLAQAEDIENYFLQNGYMRRAAGENYQNTPDPGCRQ